MLVNLDLLDYNSCAYVLILLTMSIHLLSPCTSTTGAAVAEEGSGILMCRIPQKALNHKSPIRNGKTPLRVVDVVLVGSLIL